MTLLNELNVAQREAVEQTEGPSIILAGAGSGKTRVLTYKTAYMVLEKGIAQSSILMVTFTNKAAGEMKKRIATYGNITLGYVGTFHSLSAMLLRRYGHGIGIDPNFVIFDEDDKETLIKQVIKEIPFNGKLNPSTISYKISSAKDNLLSPVEFMKFCTSTYDKAIAQAYELYQKRIEENKALDFDDLLYKTVKLLQHDEHIHSILINKYRYVLIDEFQDTNTAQYMLSKLLAGKKGNITVVGDFSQSIYSWRGAEIKNLEKFKRDFPDTKTYYLEQNYRSTQNILSFAYDIISQNTSHPILKLFTDNYAGEEVDVVPLESDEEEAIFIASKLSNMNPDEVEFNAVLYRTNSQSRAIEEAFLHYGVPYVLIGGTRFYSRKEVKDVISYLRLVVNPTDTVSKERIEKIGKRRADNFWSWLETVSQDVTEISSDEIIQKILDTTGYLDLYDINDPEDYGRLENIRELRSVAIQFPNINELLTQIALVESEYSEAEKKNPKNGVKMMTIHQAKGLEFNTVFIVGAEEGLLPHSRSLYDEHELEEERRLFYVAITRARHKVYITHAHYRYIYGRRQPSTPSRFLGLKKTYDF